MLDNQQLKTYYASFMENVRLVEPDVWFSIKSKHITKPDFVEAMRRWAADITSK